MKILNFGSLNIDNVYHVDDFVRPGETKKALSFEVFPGGKGLNQSVATRAAALFRRVGGENPCMMTGGVSRNRGVVAAIEERLGQPLFIHPDAQLCGALGAALFALEMP